MNKLVDALLSTETVRRTRTHEGAVSHATMSTGDSNAMEVLDFYSTAGSVRGNEYRATEAWKKAMSGHLLLAVRALFFVRDARGGAGERDTFVFFFRQLAETNDSVAAGLVNHIPEYGRWDDLLPFVNAKFMASAPLTYKAIMNLIASTLRGDLKALFNANPSGNGLTTNSGSNLSNYDLNLMGVHSARASESVSLCAKWLPSINIPRRYVRRNKKGTKVVGKLRNRENVAIAKRIAMYLGWSERQYRVAMSLLRGGVRIPETYITNGDYSSINYGQLPSKAHMTYRAAFHRNDGERYAKYLADVQSGKEEIKSTSLNAYEFARAYGFKRGGRAGAMSFDATLEAQWKALLAKAKENDLDFSILPVVDNSSSMDDFGFYGGNKIGRTTNLTPRLIATSMAVYFASLNEGAYHNVFMTFADNAEMVSFADGSLKDQLTTVFNKPWKGGGTYINKAYELLLQTAIFNKVSPDEMPDAIMYLSDMQFSPTVNRYGVGYGSDYPVTALEEMRLKYASFGYAMPLVIFWNINAYPESQPAKALDTGVITVSGWSQQIGDSFARMDVDNLLNMTPFGEMLDRLNGDRYANITI